MNKKNYLILEAIVRQIHFSIVVIVRFSVVLSRPYATVQLQYSHSKKLHSHTIKLCSLSLLIRSDPSYCSLGSEAGFCLRPNKQTKKKEIYRKTISWKIFMYSTHCDRNRFDWTPKNHSLYCVWEMELECVAKKLVRELLFALCSAIRWGWFYTILCLWKSSAQLEWNGTEWNSVRNLGFDFIRFRYVCIFNM